MSSASHWGLRKPCSKQKVPGAVHRWKFYANGMSDGTLRALGILTAATQLADRKRAVSFVGIEEPETALHPAAAGALIGALREAAVSTQVVITTHSPDLVDQMVLASDAVLTVQSSDGETKIAPMDPASREAIETHLYTTGELLRMDQLEPDKADLEEQRQMTLFGTNGEEE